MNLYQTVENIAEIDKNKIEIAQKYIDGLSKPIGSLGKLEKIATQLYSIRPSQKLDFEPAIVFTCAADHGIVEEGISAFPQEVTRLMVLNFLNGGAAINAFSKVANAQLVVVNVGCKGALFKPNKNLIQNKIADGSANFVHSCAMTKEQCESALEFGIKLATDAVNKGYKTIIAGEMGIGNTSSATALFCAYLGLPVEEMTGSGAGIPVKGLEHKSAVIQKALEFHKDIIEQKNPLAILQAIGGLEIATMAGIMLGAAENKCAILVDGFIASAAFLTAYKLCPKILEYTFFGHTSAESAHAKVISSFGKESLLDLGMRLGEGTGAVMGLFLLRSAMAMFNEMATLDDVMKLTS